MKPISYVEWEKLRTRVEKTRRTAKKKWLTAVVDLKTRIIIHYIITDKRPNNKAIYRLVKTSAVVAGMPTDIITDCYGAYKPAIGRLEREMKRHGGGVNHILVRSKDQSTLHRKCSRHLGVFCHLPAVDPVTSQGNDPKRSDASAISDYVVTSKLNGQIFVTCRSKY